MILVARESGQIVNSRAYPATPYRRLLPDHAVLTCAHARTIERCGPHGRTSSPRPPPAPIAATDAGSGRTRSGLRAGRQCRPDRGVGVIRVTVILSVLKRQPTTGARHRSTARSRRRRVGRLAVLLVVEPAEPHVAVGVPVVGERRDCGHPAGGHEGDDDALHMANPPLAMSRPGLVVADPVEHAFPVIASRLRAGPTLAARSAAAAVATSSAPCRRARRHPDRCGVFRNCSQASGLTPPARLARMTTVIVSRP